MTTKQFILVYAAGALASILFMWPAGFVALFFFFHVNGEIPLVVGEKEGKT